jgi:hypothetical protein
MGSDFRSEKFHSFAVDNGMRLLFSTPFHHMENNICERKARTVWQCARTLMSAAFLPPELWSFALSHAVYLVNYWPTRRNNYKSPYEIMYMKVPDTKWLYPFGCVAYIKRHAQFKHVEPSRGVRAIFLGIDHNASGHTFIFGTYYAGRDGLQITHSTDARFLPQVMFFIPESAESKRLSINSVVLPLTSISETSAITSNESCDAINTFVSTSEAESDTYVSPENTTAVTTVLADESSSSMQQKSSTIEETTPANIDDNSELELDDFNLPDEHAYLTSMCDSVHNAMCDSSGSSTILSMDSRNQFEEYIHSSDQEVGSSAGKPKNPFGYVQGVTKDPKSSKDILKLPLLEQQKWHEAEDQEWIDNLLKTTLTIVDVRSLPPNTQILPTVCVYKYKYASNKWKVRVVVLGNQQKATYDSVFAPTLPIACFRLAIAIYNSATFRSNCPDAQMFSADVKQAFCSSEVAPDDHIYVQAPLPKYRIPNKVFKLKTYLYGLQISPKAWYTKFNKLIRACGYIQSETEPCFFYKVHHVSGHLIALLVIYVDDVIGFMSLVEWKTVITELKRSIDIVDLGNATDFLGLEIRDTDSGTYISQLEYTKKILLSAAKVFWWSTKSLPCTYGNNQIWN